MRPVAAGVVEQRGLASGVGRVEDGRGRVACVGVKCAVGPQPDPPMFTRETCPTRFGLAAILVVAGCHRQRRRNGTANQC